MKKSSILAMSAICASAWAGPCPPGQRQVGQQGMPGAVVPICQTIPGGAGNAPEGRWRDNWGAFVISPGAKVWPANDQSSRADAIDMATRDCTSHGGLDCSWSKSYVNACAVVTVGPGNGGRTAWAVQRTPEVARRGAIEECETSVSPRQVCEVIYSGCSYPIRTQ